MNRTKRRIFECAMKLFNGMSDDTVRYGVADSYQKLLEVVGSIA